jgi:hypothetical protein
MKPSTAAAPRHGLDDLMDALSTAGVILDLEPDPYTEDGGEA